MPWTRYQMEQLRRRIKEIKHLRNEEQQRRLTKMPQDAHHGERHPRKVTKRISNEHLRRVPATENLFKYRPISNFKSSA